MDPVGAVLSIFDTVRDTVRVFPALSSITKLYVPLLDTVCEADDPLTHVPFGRLMRRIPELESEPVAVIVTLPFVHEDVLTDVLPLGVLLSILFTVTLTFRVLPALSSATNVYVPLEVTV